MRLEHVYSRQKKYFHNGGEEDAEVIINWNKREAKEIVELFFEKIREGLESGKTVKLSGFGGFGVRDKRQRPGRNPKTGEAIPVSARRVVTFKVSQKIKNGIAANASYLDGRPVENDLT